MQKKLFNKDFLLVVIGQIISLFGNAILRFSLPLHLLRETGSGTLYGIVIACSSLPMIVLSLLGGVLADRVNKRNIMVFLDFLTAIIMSVFFILNSKVNIVALLVVTLMLLYGISGTYQPTVQASIPSLTTEDTLLPANALINQIGYLSSLIGPVLGGLLYGSFNIEVIVIISIICFCASAVMEIFIKIPYEKRDNSQGMIAIVKEDVKEGYHFLKYDKPALIKICFIIASLNMLLASMIIVGGPILIVNILGMNDFMLGIAFGVGAAGGLTGGVLISVFGKRLKKEHSYKLLFGCTVSVFIMGVAIFIDPPAFIAYVAVVVMNFFATAFTTAFTIKILSIIQMDTPSHLIGKVVACALSFSNCAQPIGQAIYGYLFDLFYKNSWIILFAATLIALFITINAKKPFGELKEQNDNN